MKGAPPYRRLADVLRAEIAAGTFRPGQRLPTVREIATDHEVSVATAQRAVAVLQDEGLVVSAGRGGTVVTDPAVETVVVDLGRHVVEVLSAEVVEVSQPTAEDLHLTTGSRVVVLRVRTGGA